jgi:hypothetical protein
MATSQFVRRAAPATMSGATLPKTGVSTGSIGNAVVMQVAYQANAAAQCLPINPTILSSSTFVN